MRTILGTLAMFCAGPALADWRALTGDGIEAALSDQRLVYVNAWQKFDASGRTLYNAGSDSWDNWRTEADQYCSQWPPSDGWACYTVERDSDTGHLRFIGASGDVTEGRLAE